VYDLVALETALAETIFAGKLHFSPSTDSTNSDAMNAAGLGAHHGSVFLADEQRAGRGRADHLWLSESGKGLYVSVLLRLPVPPARLPLLPLAAGLAAAQAIDSVTGLKTDLRWPNDLLLGPRKVGGILVEARSGGALVVGIGINVHQWEFPTGLATPATSTDLESGRYIPRQALLISLLESLEAEALGLLQETATARILRRLAAASTWIEGREVEVHGPQACRGVTEGLDPHGFLRVRTPEGLIVVQTGGIRALNND
jgi:BirA family biotin operon repressor/biotin-[acetyl-CoA-carboxylase] ligase